MTQSHYVLWIQYWWRPKENHRGDGCKGNTTTQDTSLTIWQTGCCISKQWQSSRHVQDVKGSHYCSICLCFKEDIAELYLWSLQRFNLSADFLRCLTFLQHWASVSALSSGMLVVIGVHAVNWLTFRDEQKVEKKWGCMRTSHCRPHIRVLFCITRVF